MFLLKYDMHSIRAFTVKDGFLSFSHMENGLLSIAEILFASSADLVVNASVLNKCHRLVFALNTPPHCMEVFFKEKLIIVFDGVMYTMSKQKAEYWQKIFKDDTERFIVMESLERTKAFQKRLLEFFHEIGIVFPKYLRIYDVFYREGEFYLPMEFLSELCLVKHHLKGKNYTSKPITKISVCYDPDLITAYNESLKTLDAMTKKQLILDNTHPDLLFISAHGMSDFQDSHLENRELENIVCSINPSVVVVNACLLAQKNQGIINHFIQKGTVVISSPFYTLAGKTVFTPLLCFLNKDFFLTFMVSGLFTPRLVRYFRYIEPFE